MPGLGTLFVKLKADTAQFVAGMKSASASLQQAQGAMLAVSAAAAGMSAAIVAVGVKSVQAASQFEAGMARVKAVSQATENNFEAMRNSALELAAGTKYTAREVAGGMQFMAMAGMEASQIIGGMPAVLDLAAAGAIDLSHAADIVTNIMAGFGKTTDELAGSIDVVVKAITSANVDVPQLGVAFKYAGPVAKSAGVSFEETAAAIAMMGNAGIQGSMAGTTLRGAISKLLNPSQEAAASLKQLGVNVTDSTGRLLPLAEIVRQLGPHASSTGELMQIFGLRAGPGMAALIGMGADALEEMTGKLKTSGGIARSIAEAEMATFAGQLKILESLIERVAIQIGDILMPVTAKFVSAFQWAADVFSRFNSTTKTIIVALGALAAGAAAVVSVLAMMAIVLPPIVVGFKLLIPAIAGASAAAVPLLITLAKLTLIVVGIVAGIGALRKAWDANMGGIRDKTASVVQAMRDAFQWLWDRIGEGVKWVVQAHLDMFQMIAEALKTVTIGAVDLTDDIPKTAGEFFDILKSAGDSVVDAMGTAVDIAKDVGTGFVDSFKAGIATVGDAMMAILGEGPKAAIELDPGAGGLKPLAVGAAAGGGGGGGIPGLSGGELGEMMASAFGDAASNLTQAADQSFVDALIAEQLPKATQLAESGANFANTIVNGMGSAGSALNAGIGKLLQGDWMGAATAALGQIIGKSAAFKKMAEILGRIFEILGRAVEPVFRALLPVIDALASILNPLAALFSVLIVLEPLFRIVGMILEVVGKIILGFAKVVATVWNTLLDIVAGIAGIFSDSWAADIKNRKIKLKELMAVEANTDELDDNTEGLENNTASLGSLNDTVREVNEELGNVPDAFKIANARFNAIIGEDVQPGAIGGEGGPLAGATVIIQTQDADDAWEKLKDAQRRDSLVTAGATVVTAPPYVYFPEGGGGPY